MKLREAHAHIANLGRQMGYADVSGCTSADALLRIIRDAAEETTARYTQKRMSSLAEKPKLFPATRKDLKDPRCTSL